MAWSSKKGVLVKVRNFYKEKLAVMIFKKRIFWKIIRNSENQWLARAGLKKCLEPRRQDPRTSHKTEASWSTAIKLSFTHLNIKVLRERASVLLNLNQNYSSLVERGRITYTFNSYLFCVNYMLGDSRNNTDTFIALRFEVVYK